MGRKKPSVTQKQLKKKQNANAKKTKNIPKETLLEARILENLDELDDEPLLNGFTEEYREVAKGPKLFLIF